MVYCRFGLPYSLLASLASSQARKLPVLSSTHWHLQSGAVQYSDCEFSHSYYCRNGTIELCIPYSADVPGSPSQVHGSSMFIYHRLHVTTLSLHALTLAQYVSPISSRHLCVEMSMVFQKLVIQRLISPIAVWASYMSSHKWGDGLPSFHGHSPSLCNTQIVASVSVRVPPLYYTPVFYNRDVGTR